MWPARVSEIQTDTGWQPAVGEITISSQDQPSTNFFKGQSVEISGTISRPPTAGADGIFDDRFYLQARGIFYELKTQSPDDWQLGESALPGPPLTDRFLEWSKHTMELGLPEQETLRLLWAMTLGWRTAFTGDVGDPFLQAGTIVDFVFK